MNFQGGIELNDLSQIKKPYKASEIITGAIKHGFHASCDDLLGNFIRMLVATKKNSNILELGTGVGYSAAWILDGMDQESTLTSVEFDENYSKFAQVVLGNDPRVTFIAEDGGEYIERHKHEKFDLIFADTWPGKFYLVDETLNMVKPGGIYMIDDLNPQPNWPEDHQEKVNQLIELLEARDDYHMCKLNWSTGLIIMTKK